MILNMVHVVETFESKEKGISDNTCKTKYVLEVICFQLKDNGKHVKLFLVYHLKICINDLITKSFL